MTTEPSLTDLMHSTADEREAARRMKFGLDYWRDRGRGYRRVPAILRVQALAEWNLAAIEPFDAALDGLNRLAHAQLDG